jgi:hypothetical protein
LAGASLFSFFCVSLARQHALGTPLGGGLTPDFLEDTAKVRGRSEARLVRDETDVDVLGQKQGLGKIDSSVA